MLQIYDAPRESVEELFVLLYDDLRRMARSRLCRAGRHALLDASSLVHEAFLRMHCKGGAPVNSREHFLAYVSTTMRSIIVDFWRQRNSNRREGGAEHVTLDTGDIPEACSNDAILSIRSALDTLTKIDARLARMVELRYFEGLTDIEVGASLGVTDRTVRRDWERARVMLADMIGR